MTADKQPAQTLVGTVLDGRYRIESLLGEGGMGAVYSATDLRLEKRVAVKVMAREFSANPEVLARFHREAQVTSGLGHPNIVQVFDSSTTPTGEPFLVMEFLEGEDLEHRLRREVRLSTPAMLHILKQVAAALMATHAKGIVHRDLKPANIYLLKAAGADDFVKVLDFGISKVRAASTKLTKTSSIMGTPNYMSPEQALGRGEEYDETTVQWALACIAWECLSGQGPFLGENVPSILFQVVHEQPPSLAPMVAGLPQEVEEVLRCALAKDKRQRFASITAYPRGTLRGNGTIVTGVKGGWDVWYDPSTDNTPCVSYVASNKVESIEFDLKYFIDDAIASGYGVKSSQYLSIIFAGFEVWGGGDGLQVKHFCADVK